jgi:DNA-binding transcriptional ArsR family regulator
VELVFKALADLSRRKMLDELYMKDGQTLLELSATLPGMTRFGVMKHLRVLESAGLVVTRREGRLKRHFLNPLPIQRIHNRWFSKFNSPAASSSAPSAIESRHEKQ